MRISEFLGDNYVLRNLFVELRHMFFHLMALQEIDEFERPAQLLHRSFVESPFEIKPYEIPSYRIIILVKVKIQWWHLVELYHLKILVQCLKNSVVLGVDRVHYMLNQRSLKLNDLVGWKNSLVLLILCFLCLVLLCHFGGLNLVLRKAIIYSRILIKKGWMLE